MNKFDDTIPWYAVTFFLFVVFLLIWRSDPKKSPNYKRF